MEKSGVGITNAKKPDELLRANLTKRAADHIALANSVIPKSMRKSPSEKKCDRARLHEQKRAGRHHEPCIKAAHENLIFDCCTCPKYPCGIDPVACGEIMILERCGGCGLPVRHYRDANHVWTKCLGCRGKA